jgi:hypothetical protein
VDAVNAVFRTTVLMLLAALFAAYHVVLALISIDRAADARFVMVALVLYVAAMVVSLSGQKRLRLDLIAAMFNLAVAIAVPLLVTSQLDRADAMNGAFSTWYVGAIGMLLAVTAARSRVPYAWMGIGFLVFHTIVWGGIGALVPIGITGAIAWTAAATAISRALENARRERITYATAERGAAQWKAAQDARLVERRDRLQQTSGRTLPMLYRIVDSAGRLTPRERDECRYLEQAMRDEIRGRMLLDDAVRDAVMDHRRAGSTVTLLDEGGLDEVGGDQLTRVRTALAEALRGLTPAKIVVRTAQDRSEHAVTVVALDEQDANAALLGDDGSDDAVQAFIQIPRDPEPSKAR